MSAGDRAAQAGVEGNPVSEIEQLKREVASLRTMVMKLGRLDNATNDMGRVTQGQFVAEDDDGIVRWIMSAINILAEFGISAHWAGFNTNQRPQIWASADDGAFTAAGGNFKIDARSITLLGQILAQSTGAVDLHIVGGIYTSDDGGGTSFCHGFHSFEYAVPHVEKITNGDAETGDATGWTVTGSPSIVEDGAQGRYCFNVDLNNKYSQTFNTVAGHYYLLKFMSKAENDGFAMIDFIGADVVSIETWAGDAWMQDYCLMRATGAFITIILKADELYGDGEFVKFDDISVLELEHFATVGTTNPHGQIELDSSIYISLNAPAINLSRVNLPVGQTYNINGSPHTHSGLAPAGGSTGQVLKKINNTNYNYSWQPDAGGSGGLVLTEVEVNLGSIARRAGKFDITGSGFSAGQNVVIVQCNGPYTGKGARADEAEMDQVIVSGKATSDTNIECYWISPTKVKGNVKFAYAVG